MNYLLDVSVLVALGHTRHEFHKRVADWAVSIDKNEWPKFYTSSIIELGFVRIMSQAYMVSVRQAQVMLSELKESKDYRFEFISDDQDASRLPSWVTLAKHTTDGHLAELAISNGCVLATLDENIPGSFVIPE